MMAGIKAENPGGSTWAFSQEIPDSWEDCELETEPSFGKPDQGGLLLPTDVHVTSNEGNEAIVVDSWEDCDAEITAPSTERSEAGSERPLQSPWFTDQCALRESSIPISDDFIDEEFDREAEITPEVRPDTRNTASTTSDRQHLGDCDNKNNGNRESEINGCHSGSIGEDLDYLDVDEDEWWEIWSEQDAQFYYHNKQTKEVVWSVPDDANVIRYGTGPDGGTPYYSPFYSKDFQAKVGAPATNEETKNVDDEFLVIPEFQRNESRAVSLCTDVSFKGGVCQESFSFDGSSERDFAEFLDFVHDGEACLKPTNSVSRPQALVQQSGLGSEKKGAASPPGSPRGLLRSNCSSHSMARRQSGDSPAPLPSRSSRSSSINRPSSPPRIPSPDGKTKAQRPLRAGRSPAPMMVTWGVPKSPLESFKNPFARPARSEGPVLLNRESSSLTLNETSIQEIVNSFSLSLEAMPSFDVPPAQSSVGSNLSLTFGHRPPTPDNLEVFGKRCQPPRVPRSSEASRKSQ